MSLSAFAWPVPEGKREVSWTGRGFVVDGKLEPILAFGVKDSGWTDDLTALHEGNAGADHPIDLASRARAVREVVAHTPKAGGGVVLEVGCSSGYLLDDLSRALPGGTTLIGSDYVAGPLRALADRTPTRPLLRFDLTRCPLPTASVDVAVALNVLEHIEDDQRAARELARIIKPGGAAVIELPAAPGLYDVYDKALMHFRRYTLEGACSLFEDAGFRVIDRSHVGVFVFPAFAAVKLRNQRHLSATPAEQQRLVEASLKQTRKSRLMALAMKLEERLAERVSYPFGIRCVLTAVRR